MLGSDESVNSYQDDDVNWDEESDVDGDGGTESEPDDGEASDDERDVFAKDGSGEEEPWSYIVSDLLCSILHVYTGHSLTPPLPQDTQTHSVEDDEQSSVRSFHTDSSGHEVEEFRLSRRSHMDLVRALEGRNSEVQSMRDRIKDLEVRGGRGEEAWGLVWRWFMSPCIVICGIWLPFETLHVEL